MSEQQTLTQPKEPTTETSLQLIQALEDYVLSCHKVPMTTRVIINEDQFFVLLDKLRDTLPTELHQAQEIVNQKQRILSEAQSKAQDILKQSEAQSKATLEKSNIVKEAKNFVSQAKKEAEMQRYEADKYSEEVLADLEQKVKKALSVVKTGRDNLAQNMAMSTPGVATN